MTAANETTGVLALALMLLVCRGFAPHMRLRGRDPVIYLMQGIFIGSAIIAARIATYDAIYPLLQAVDLMKSAPMRPATELLNTTFNAGFSLGAWRILKGLHASLPEAERDHYSWLTCAWYPARINLYRRTGQ